MDNVAVVAGRRKFVQGAALTLAGATLAARFSWPAMAADDPAVVGA
jgi:hypothetical protein